jgi:integrase
LRKTILPVFGARKVADITAADVQTFVDRLHASGTDPSTLRNAVMPLRAIYRRACRPGGPALVNPTTGLQLPAVRGRRDRIASPEEAARLIELLPRQFDRTLWATVFYAGLRLGELLALRWDGVDLARGEIRVTKGYDRWRGSSWSRRAEPDAARCRSLLSCVTT